MHVITRKRLNDFAQEYPEAATALARWYVSIRSNNFSSLPGVEANVPDSGPGREADGVQCRW